MGRWLCLYRELGVRRDIFGVKIFDSIGKTSGRRIEREGMGRGEKRHVFGASSPHVRSE